MIMKIQKKEKQLSHLKVLNHSPMSDASVTFDYKSPSPFDHSTDQEEKIEDVASHCLPQKDLYPAEEEAETLFPRKMTSHNGMEDSGGGGTGVKKKRKKKDPVEQEGAAKGRKDREPKPKRKREPREPKEPRKAKEPRRAKEPKDPKQKDGAKKARKPREVSGTKEAKEKRSGADSTARTKSRKASKEQGPTPVEKKKKGKRKSETTVESLELDQGLPNPSLRSPEESTESTDSQKRRSGRQVKRRKYNEDLDFKVVDDDGETIAVLGAGRASALSASTLAWQAEEPPEDDANIIEKILASKTVQEVHPGEPPFDLELFYVKYRNFSYLHCKWATMEELEKDPRIAQKIKRFRNKQAQMKHIFTEPDEDLFNPDYVEVDRILEVAHTKDAETGEEVTHYLVKWCSLPYEESTWELEEDVDPAKVKEFESLQVLPEIKHMERPASDSWQKLEKSREYKNSNQLREYQLEGMNWLLFNWYNRKNCILADEMGLGKTIQSITFLSEIFLRGVHGPFLIIAPLSTITNWEREFRTWTEMNAIVYHGSQISRQMIQQYEMVYRDAQGNPLSGVFKFHVVITTFEMILADCPELKKIHWSCVIIDEAHRLKNRNCKLLEGLKLMALEHKVLLTGTPLQNSVEELFSLLNFLEPSQFPSETAFLEEFGDLKTEEQVKKLQSILKPMMLRRLKDDVEKNLAPKQETIIEVELTNIQKKYYRAILEKNFSFLTKGANQHNMPNLINTMMELRKCCNHPYLINGAEEKILEDFRKTHSSDAPDFQLQAMIQAAGKLVLIDKLLPKLIAGGHKVLIFSQMVRCLDILEDYLIQRRYTYERIDGRVRGNLRQAAIDRFCKPDSDRFVFLLCTRAGGLGINLTAADTCIIFDSDWNPQNDLQAQARCHRIGQSKAVKVYRLITRNSYEREMFDKASLKLGLDKAVLQDINRKGSTNGVQQLSKMEVEDLLRKGAYGALMDEEDEGSKFCEEDIDQILQRRTHTITIQSEGQGSTFAKASFVASGNRTDISLDDPNFWQKWAKIAELDTEAKNEKESLVLDRPRVRKQTKHYNSFEEDELMEFSELDSDSDERPTRSRRLNDKTRRYLRAECFRVEKNLLIFGWGRWKDILTHGRFKWHLNEKDMEMICRALLVYCVKHYKGDEKIKSFIWELITPTKDGQAQTLQNHSGLSAPVPRGRKGKKTKNQLLLPELKNADWLATCNPEVVLHDDGYKKHLKQHCNKVLLRVRMLYYLKAEILGEAADKAFEGTPARELEVPLPDIDYVEIPVDWWDAEADKSLLIGVFKHGYERYNAMRADPALCFLEKVGMPDEKSLSAEQGVTDGTSDIPERSNTDKDDNTEDKLDGLRKQVESSSDGGDGIFGEEKKDDSRAAQDGSDPDKSPWPVSSALTARLRRLVTIYQRCNRKELCRPEILGPGNQGYWVQEEMFRRTSEMDLINKEAQKRWTRREQADFYRTVSSFGVVYDQEKKTFDWAQFRIISRLDKKSDESLEHYFYSFVAMCRHVCRLPPWKDGGPPDPTICVEPITEERAARTLYRIELLRKVREQVLTCPQLHERLQLCRPSLYLPVWWECGKHDRDLLIGTAKHGLNRTDYYVMTDPQLSFLDAYRNYAQHKRPDTQAPESLYCLYQTNSKLYESPTYTQMSRTSESLETEPENLGQIEGRDDHLGPPGGSLSDITCENFISKVQDVISITHEESLLPESLESMMYGKKGLSREPGSFQESPHTNTEARTDALGISASRGANCRPNGHEAAVAAGPSLMDSLEAGVAQMNIKNGEHVLMSLARDKELCCNEAKQRPESVGQLEATFLASPSLDQGNESGFVDMCNLSVCDSKRNPSSEQQLIDLLENKSLETDLILNQNHSDEEEEEEENEEENLDVAAGGRGRPEVLPLSEPTASTPGEKGRGLHAEEAQTGRLGAGSRSAGLQGAFPQVACQCHCKHLERWTRGLESDEFEVEKPKGHSPDLYKSKTNNVTMEGELTAIPLEPFKVKHELVKEPWKESAEGKKGFPTYPPEGSELKSEDMDFESKDDYDRDGNCHNQDYPGKYSEEESKSSTSGLTGDIGDDLQEARAPTIAQLLQEKTLYSFSEWPKDRVIINRLDNICHVVLNGKWPPSQQYEPSGTLPAPVLASTVGSRSSLSEPEVSEHSFSNGAALVAQIQKDSFLAPVFPKDEQKHRRPYEFEVERDAKARNLEQFSATHGHPPIILNGWHGESAIDLSCTSEGSPGATSPFPVSASTPKIGAISSLQGALGMDLSGILQAGLIHPVTGQIVNGSLRRDDAAARRRRGRRKHAEGGMDLIFLKEQTLQAGILEVHENSGQASLSTSHPEGPVPAPSTPEPAPAAGSQAEKTIPSKSLLDWLRQQADYSLDVPGFGAGFLPENKFNHTLTEPVLRDAGPRRRGRRPRSELLKAPAIAADSPSGMGPLFMNGLIAGMDLVGLQNMRNMPGIPLTGLVGFPAGFATMPTGEEVKSTLSMLPMMLPGMATMPQMFGVGGLLNAPMATTCTSTAPAPLSSTTKSGTSVTEQTAEDKPSSRDGKTDMSAEDKPGLKPGPSPYSDQSEPAITTSSPVAFNPFLIPGVSPGLIYPPMFLSPGMGMALPAMQQARHSEIAGLESQKRKKKKTKGDNPNPNPEPAPGSDREPGNDQNCPESRAPVPSDREHAAQAGDRGLKDSNSDTN
ncbi:chromodomain-helicase-DNA-binding protein 6 isoform X2 [Myotis daubentonii]|uniref:chromodomain-helicase-DNA-binding protein 6 isoform X2 n=1 Tax=Myotis daubentonii TaxID=98922 RepID=UPI00287325B9|nr:chromodomain-helicase-DNA-binding protein 6 isoform X2 [Myotis daubentonii]